MLDLAFICENLDAIRTNCTQRGVNVDLSGLEQLAARRKTLIAQTDDSRRQQKEISEQIPKASADDKPRLVQQGRTLREQVTQLETDLKEVEAALKDVQSQIPNLTHPDAPIGATDADSKTVRTWGTPRAFEFTPLDHVTLMQKHNLLDLEAGSKVTGHGFYFLKNEAVLLELALVQYAVQRVLAAGFTLHITPDLAREEILEGIGFQPRGNETQIYSVRDTDLCLVATAEITLGGSLQGEILEESKLPLKFAGLSHCFRTEAGAHGKASRGIYRVHQFTKVEMFAFTTPDLAVSDAVHQEIVAIEESLFQGLGVPYRVIDTCTGDLGGPAYRKFDLEAWMPGRSDGRGEYGEVTSASNCTDYQARRLNIRCKSPERKGTQFVHTLNGTAIAVTRAMIAVLENYQQADGSIIVPEVLRPWVGKDRIG